MGSASHETFGGGSAFDAFVSYEAQAESRFVGVECKYAEDLSKSSIKSIRNFTYPDGPRAGERPPSYVKYEQHTKRAFVQRYLDFTPVSTNCLRTTTGEAVFYRNEPLMMHVCCGEVQRQRAGRRFAAGGRCRAGEYRGRRPFINPHALEQQPQSGGDDYCDQDDGQH
jgi:hypothetical protein